MSSLNGLLTVNDLYFAISFAIVFTANDKVVPLKIYPFTYHETDIVRGDGLVRDSDDKVAAGFYIIYPQDEKPPPLRSLVEMPTSTRQLHTVAGPLAAIDVPVPSDSSTASQRDSSSSPSSFKGRLIIRDGTCVVCHAAGIPREAYYYDLLDSLLFEGARIVALEYHQHWENMYLKDSVKDPFTDPDSPLRDTGQRGSSTPSQSLSHLRMNSLENGLLLCLEHHKMYDNGGFTIQPETHKIYALHPRYASLHGKTVTKPWLFNDLAKYPAPTDEILRAHCLMSTLRALKAGVDQSEDDDFEVAGFADSMKVEEQDVLSWAAQVAVGGSQVEV